jgi:pimeloyl-ACP methyl ester carboxylesterase
MSRITQLLACLAVVVSPAIAAADEPQAKGKYADVNGLKMYYEVHGTGRPLVMLHGAFGWAMVFPELDKNRQVIAVELQGHAHTADIDRPLAIEQLADDVAELLQQLKIKEADFFGYSMGGNVALGVAVRHPQLVRKLVINGSHYSKMKDAYEPEVYKQFLGIGPDFAPEVLKGPYDRMAPDPKRWPVLVSKVTKMAAEFKGFSREQLQGIKAHVLIAQGDRDGVRPEHAVEMFRLIPNSQLAIFPGGDHFMLVQRPDSILPAVAAFLDAPLPAGNAQGKQ